MSSAKSNPVWGALTALFRPDSAQKCEGPAQEREGPVQEPQELGYFYNVEDKTWCSAIMLPTPAAASSRSFINPNTLRLISWNIDMSVMFAEARMQAALQFLDDLTSSTPADIPVVIFLQEMTNSDLEQIKASTWIRDRFFITDVDKRNWLNGFYGTITLIDNRLQMNRVFRIPWTSRFGRDGLFVDIALTSDISSNNKKRILRLCNTHLESLVANPPIRPVQLSAASDRLEDVHVTCALLAGDLNAIEPFDRTLHSENELKDAYLELGGEEDSHEGYTWGYQVPVATRERFGCSRLDKILFRGDVLPKQFERIGIDVKVAEDVRERMRDVGCEEWVTDHYGVMGDFELINGWSLNSQVKVDGLVRSELT